MKEKVKIAIKDFLYNALFVFFGLLIFIMFLFICSFAAYLFGPFGFCFAFVLSIALIISLWKQVLKEDDYYYDKIN